jgi:transcriptional regulator with XRE-family HTH domain
VVVRVKQGRYCGRVPQPDWPVSLTRSIAGEIRRWRGIRGLSAQQVADSCARLGLQLSRSTLADLENGRRPLISVAELLALAAVLDVAPALLVAPVGRRPEIEILPGREMRPRDAVGWLGGELGLQLDPEQLDWLDWHDPRGLVAIYRRHDELVDDLIDEDMWRWEPMDLPPGVMPAETPELRRAARRRVEDDLRAVRGRMRELDLVTPELPPQLASIDRERRR